MSAAGGYTAARHCRAGRALSQGMQTASSGRQQVLPRPAGGPRTLPPWYRMGLAAAARAGAGRPGADRGRSGLRCSCTAGGRPGRFWPRGASATSRAYRRCASRAARSSACAAASCGAPTAMCSSDASSLNSGPISAAYASMRHTADSWAGGSFTRPDLSTTRCVPSRIAAGKAQVAGCDSWKPSWSCNEGEQQQAGSKVVTVLPRLPCLTAAQPSQQPTHPACVPPIPPCTAAAHAASASRVCALGRPVCGPLPGRACGREAQQWQELVSKIPQQMTATVALHSSVSRQMQAGASTPAALQAHAPTGPIHGRPAPRTSSPGSGL